MKNLKASLMISLLVFGQGLSAKEFDQALGESLNRVVDFSQTSAVIAAAIGMCTVTFTTIGNGAGNILLGEETTNKLPIMKASAVGCAGMVAYLTASKMYEEEPIQAKLATGGQTTK